MLAFISLLQQQQPAFISFKERKKNDAARNAVEACVLLAKLTCKVEREKKKTEGLEIGRGGRRSKRVRVGVGGVCSG